MPELWRSTNEMKSTADAWRENKALERNSKSVFFSSYDSTVPSTSPPCLWQFFSPNLLTFSQQQQRRKQLKRSCAYYGGFSASRTRTVVHLIIGCGASWRDGIDATHRPSPKRTIVRISVCSALRNRLRHFHCGQAVVILRHNSRFGTRSLSMFIVHCSRAFTSLP